MRSILTSAVLAILVSLTQAATRKEPRIPSDVEINRMKAALPDQAPATPVKPRKVLIWGRLWTHDPNVMAARTIEAMGRKTGAFEPVVSEDPKDLLPEKLKDFDALVMNNTHQQEPFLPEPAELKALSRDQQEQARQFDQQIKKSLESFVGGGKGLVGIHAATAACAKWPEYGQMMGAYHAGQIGGNVTIKLDDSASPINAGFGGQPFKLSDEIYYFREPYSRARLRVLLSLDLSAMKDPEKRPDKDYAISWVHRYGQGRVFYCSIPGHSAGSFQYKALLQHILAGIQYALGDLQAEDSPVANARGSAQEVPRAR